MHMTGDTYDRWHVTHMTRVTGDMAVLRPYEREKTSQQWMVKDERVENRFNPKWVMAAGEGFRVTATNFTGAPSQTWRVELL